jgi:hypothetical protein
MDLFLARFFFCIAVGLEWGPLSIVRMIEELIERKVWLQSKKLR